MWNGVAFGEGESFVNQTGKTLLGAANPTGSDVSWTAVMGSCVLSLVFAPVVQVPLVAVRVVPELLCALVLGAAFMRKHRSIISFDEKEGFGPTPESTWVSLSLV